MSVFFSKHDLDSDWNPRIDVYRTSCGWVVKLDAAGLNSTDLSVSVQGSRVQVAGCRKDRTLQKDWRHYSMEISYSRFQRTIELPQPLEGAQIELENREGMILIHLRTQK